jgi:hypothetical protein
VEAVIAEGAQWNTAILEYSKSVVGRGDRMISYLLVTTIVYYVNDNAMKRLTKADVFVP